MLRSLIGRENDPEALVWRSSNNQQISKSANQLSLRKGAVC